ncbi:hypothetical protein EB796_014484 [Bugula neritina]|uniref:Uncharacterized protein n=1 Tax=Bugula neritina TaxID=10212 RepID=A0A7J7JNN3_BUGNE|nr:hypothetical protein EB796_014484 [Bugula neritina]
MAMLSQSVTDLKSALRDKERQLEEARQHLQLNADKFSKDVANLEQQMVNLQNIINSKDMEIESLKGDRLTKLEAELLEKDRQISSYVESYRQQENLIEELKAAAENGEDKPDCTSTPEVRYVELQAMCVGILRLDLFHTLLNME